MAHAFAGRRSNTRNKTNDRFFHIGFAPLSGVCFVWSADFANHDDGVGIRIVIERLHHIDVFQAIDGVTTNTDSTGLAQTYFGQHGHRFIGQRARARNHADASFAMDVSRHDADFDFVRRDEAWAIRA